MATRRCAGAGKGRCAGCGLVGPTGKVQKHVMNCSSFVALVARDKTLPDPRSEYDRWLAAEGSAEAKSEAKGIKREARLSSREAGIEAAHSRWETPPDPLAD